MGQALDQGRIWLEQGRADRAEGALRRSLHENPHDPVAHALLSLCLSRLGRAEEAEQEAESSIRSAPDGFLGHYALATALEGRGKMPAALAAVEEAIRLDPRDADAWSLLGLVHLGERRWQDALKAAERGLALDAEHVGCGNVRARAQTQLGRRVEAAETFRRALAAEPENAGTHANLGWALLQRGDVAAAAESFREALRISPGLEGARAGLLEAIKARNRFYRAMLGFFLWMGRLPRRTVWLVLLAIFFAPRALRALAKANPGLQPLLLPLAIPFLLFAYLTWIVDPLFNVTLFFHPLGRHALTRRERSGALAVAGCLFGGLVALGGALLPGAAFLLPFAIVLLAYVMPLSAAFAAEGRTARAILTAAAVGLGALGVGGAATAILGIYLVEAPDRTALVSGLGVILLLAYAAGILVVGLLANRYALGSRTD